MNLKTGKMNALLEEPAFVKFSTEIETVEENNVIYPYRQALLITKNGQMWATKVPAFIDSEDYVIGLYNADLEKFQKVN
jgi:hypothetical protein